jgi:hypothetical protein
MEFIEGLPVFDQQAPGFIVKYHLPVMPRLILDVGHNRNRSRLPNGKHTAGIGLKPALHSGMITGNSLFLLQIRTKPCQ